MYLQKDVVSDLDYKIEKNCFVRTYYKSKLFQYSRFVK